MKAKDFTIKLNPQSWEKEIKKAGKDTPSNYDVWKVGDKFKKPKKGNYTLRLVNGLGSFENALQYAKDNNLALTSPYHVWALAQQYDLKKELDSNYGYAVATQECTFEGRRQACYAWWYDAGRKALLDWVSSFTSSSDWFAFLCKFDFKKVSTSDLSDLELRISALEEFQNKVEKVLKIQPNQNE